MRLRGATADDAAALAALYFESARRLGVRYYSPAQVEAWAPAPAETAKVQTRLADGRVTLIAVGADDLILGYADLEADGHFDHLYVHPNAAGRASAPP